jgi:low temperature requirement protein LtrA
VLGRGLLGLVFVYGHFSLLAGTAAFGAGMKLAIKHGSKGSLPAGDRWIIAGGIVAYLLSLSAFHLAAEWTSLRDRALVGRILVAALLLLLAAVATSPLLFTSLVALVLAAQLVLELRTYPTGAASVWTPPPKGTTA